MRNWMNKTFADGSTNYALLSESSAPALINGHMMTWMKVIIIIILCIREAGEISTIPLAFLRDLWYDFV